MSADIVNLRQARKDKKRRDKDKAAEDNRRKFGRTKAERETARRNRQDLERKVEGHKLDKSHLSDGDDGA